VGADGRVCAGQGAARTEAARRGRFDLKANCYQNCYRWGGRGAGGIDPGSHQAVGEEVAALRPLESERSNFAADSLSPGGAGLAGAPQDAP